MQICIYKQARALRKRKNNTAKCDTMNKYIFHCTATGEFIQIEKYVNQKYFDQKYIIIHRQNYNNLYAKWSIFRYI